MWELIKSIFDAFGIILSAIWGAITIGVQLIGGWLTVFIVAIVIVVAFLMVCWIKNRSK